MHDSIVKIINGKLSRFGAAKLFVIAVMLLAFLFGCDSAFAADTENLLLVDFENDAYIPDELLNSSANCKLKSDCLEISPNWANKGYTLNRSIGNEDKWYSLTFEFKIKEKSSGYQLMLSETASETDGIEAYRQLGVLMLTDSSRFKIAGKELGGVKWKDNKWYLYSLKFNPYTTEIKARITQRNSESDYAEYSGTTGNAGSWGDGIPIREYDTLKFTYDGVIDIADINLSVLGEKPIYTRVSGEKVGNIFSASDEKVITAEFENVLSSSVDAQISYEIFDESKLLAKKTIGAVRFEPNEKISKSINLDVQDFGTYKIVFQITCDSNEESLAYNSSKFSFSVADKFLSGDIKNPKMRVNIPYVYNMTEWQKIKTLISDAGITGVRDVLTWYDTEPQKGSYISPDVTCWYEDAADCGISNTMVLSASNPIYNNGNWNDAFPHLLGENAYDAWERYITYIAVQYQNQVTDYEIINEPNWSMQPEVYADYLKRANKIIKKFNQTAKVTGFVTGDVPWWWIECVFNIIKDNPSEYADIISVHQYDFDDGDYKTSIEGESWSIRFRDDIYSSKLQQLESLMQTYNCGELKLNISEVAISSTSGICSSMRQAAEFVQLMTTDAAQQKTNSIYWYCLENTMPRGDSDYTEYDIEGNFGLVGNRCDVVPYAAKPVYVAACAYNKLVGGAEFIGSLSQNGAKAYRFKKNGADVAIIWSENTEQSIGLDLGVSGAAVYDKYGNKMGDLISNNGKFSFNAGFEPIYIVGSFAKYELSEPEILISKNLQTVAVGDTVNVSITDLNSRSPRAEFYPSSFVKTSNITTDGTVIGIDAKMTGISDSEESLLIKLYKNNKLIYVGKTYFMIQTLDISKVSGNGINDGTINKSATEAVVNIFAENVKLGSNPQLLTAYYGQNSELLRLDCCSDVNVLQRGILLQSVSLNIPDNCGKIKFYLFDSLKNIVPYSKPMICYTDN